MKSKSILVVVVLISSCPSLFADNGWGVRQLSSGTKRCQYKVGLSENSAVWLEGDDGNWQVIFWDGTTSQQISSGENECTEVQICDGSVAWREYISDKLDR